MLIHTMHSILLSLLLSIVFFITGSFTFIDVQPLLSQYLSETIYSCDYIESIPSSNTTIILPDWLCNEVNYTTFDFSRFANLEYLQIGNDSFSFVETFVIDGMNNLTMLQIGAKSFTHYKDYDYWYPGSSFYIRNCKSLESIDIGRNSFSDYTGSFELVNLPSLQYISIGEMMNDDWSSHNFYSSPFIVRGNKEKLDLIE